MLSELEEEERGRVRPGRWEVDDEADEEATKDFPKIAARKSSEEEAVDDKDDEEIEEGAGPVPKRSRSGREFTEKATDEDKGDDETELFSLSENKAAAGRREEEDEVGLPLFDRFAFAPFSG